MQGESFDVAVIGGGPAGSTASTFLSRYGRRVVLIEKSRHPRFHVGESLLPMNLPLFERLGVLEAVSAIGQYKPGAEFISPDHAERQVFSFADGLDPMAPNAYNVARAEFDELLLRNAEANGVIVKEGIAASVLDRRADGWRIALGGGSDGTEISARFLVDASGRDGLLPRTRKLRRRNPEHNSAAIFAHFRNVSPEAFSIAGNLSIFWFEHGWIWMIPLRSGLTSVGVVSMPDYLKTRDGPLDEFFTETLRLCPKAWSALAQAARVTPVRGAGNYAYHADRAFGDGYVLVGDAYRFVDPIFSSGIYFAMTAAETAAGAVHVALDHPERAPRLFRRYQRMVDGGISRLNWFIYRFNSPILKDLFMNPRNVLGVRVREAVVSVLAGDVFRGGALSLRLAVFKAIFHISRLVNFRADRAERRRRRGLASIAMPEDEISGGL